MESLEVSKNRIAFNIGHIMMFRMTRYYNK